MFPLAEWSSGGSKELQSDSGSPKLHCLAHSCGTNWAFASWLMTHDHYLYGIIDGTIDGIGQKQHPCMSWSNRLRRALLQYSWSQIAVVSMRRSFSEDLVGCSHFQHPGEASEHCHGSRRLEGGTAFWLCLGSCWFSLYRHLYICIDHSLYIYIYMQNYIYIYISIPFCGTIYVF